VKQLRRVTAADVDRTHAAAALDSVFAQYVVPISFSEPQYAAHVAVNDIDLAASPIWYDGDDVVAAAVLGVRGRRGLGGFGLVPEYRGRGLARELLADVLERAWALDLESVTLEVLEQNPSARQTYGTGGFKRTRRLLTYEIDPSSLNVEAACAPYVDAEKFIDLPLDAAPCWQMEDVSLRRLPTQLHAVGNASSFCIFQHHAKVAALVRTGAPTAEQLAWLVANVVAQTGAEMLSMFGVPEESQIAEGARALGWRVAHVADEMELRRERTLLHDVGR
jgi:ribosomal protein S18 acetylase RimI-like enzyme